ncbi:MAG: asparagine synthase (glutamine-hydrolyzing) [Pyrinomonadaceae bacterium]
MCGIAGIAGITDRAAAAQAVQQMTCALVRRGPDGEGLEVWDQAALGHRRLAIFDLSEAGHQPMCSPDRSIGVVFNGAIYNFLELRTELQKRGYEFRSQTDTEVLVHGYREWGIDELISRLRGMFAIAIWDDKAQKLFLIRDRLGVKPLVYAVRGNQLAFASTLRALRRGGFVSEIDDQAITEYLHFGYVTDDCAIYRGAIKVPAATIIEWSPGGTLQPREYWSPPVAQASSQNSFDEVIEETERLFLRAVEMRLHADVPVGALLSGGVDSSLVCWAVARLGGDVTAYTIGIPGDPWDETEDARATAQQLGITHRVLELSADDAPEITELVAAYAEPFACASALGMLRLSRAVAPSATVLLTGDGGDDVFLGYPEHRHLWLAERLSRRLPAAAASGWMACRNILPRGGLLRRAASFLDYASGGIGAVACTKDGLPMYERHNLLGERLAGATISQREVAWSPAAGRRVLAEYLEYDRRTRFVGEFLPKVDGATMYHALEARSPFLDQELWEFAAAQPFEVRLRGGQLKAILRELARRKLGEQVARGRKRGFGVPVQRWIVGRWRNTVEELLRDSILGRESWIRTDAVLAQLAIAAQKQWAPHQLWYLFVLESWLRHEQDETINERATHVQAVPASSCLEVGTGGAKERPVTESAIR